MAAARRYLAGALFLSVAGLVNIQMDEGQVNHVYLDPVSIPTVCVGHTGTVQDTPVGTAYTDAECAELLREDTQVAQAAVRKAVRVPITQVQFDRLVSFTFNVGTGAFRSSTLLRKLNAGECRGAAEQFLRWNRAGGRVLKGLTLRRQRDRDAFIKDCP